MFDIHTHILPGIDDGPGDWERSLAMLRVAARDGVKGVVVTPHVTPGLYDNRREKVAALAAELRARAGDIPVEIYEGSELAVCAEALEGLKSGRYCTINSGRYVLVELPSQFSADGVYDFLVSLASLNLIPVIAHPERNPKVQADIEALYAMAELGALMQVTAGSLTGQFGSAARKTAQDMFARRLAHVIASDAHDDSSRAPTLKPGLTEAAKLVGERAAKAMVEAVPEKIIKGEPFKAENPVRPKKSLFFFSDLPFFD